MKLSEEEWRKKLTKEEYRVLREKGTEAPNSGKYNLHFERGKFYCKACNNLLFKSENKFKSDCGWPSFDDAIEGAIKHSPDYSHNMVRKELSCNRCGSHLGHVFDDGPTNTGLRYCINSICLKFKS